MVCVATNVNDAGGEYLRSGHYAPRTAVQTYSNAMDVGNPSNVARLRSQFHDNVEEIHRWVDAVSIGEDDTLKQIRSTYERTGKVLDPHTAVGLAAARRQPRSFPVIVTSTAHPAKFPDVVQRALGIRIPLPEGLLDSFRRPKSSVQLPGTYESFKRLVMHEQ